MSLPIFAAVFSLIVVMVILSTSIEAIVVENHSVYASYPSSPSSEAAVHAADFNFAAAGDWGCNANTNNTVNNILTKIQN